MKVHTLRFLARSVTGDALQVDLGINHELTPIEAVYAVKDAVILANTFGLGQSRVLLNTNHVVYWHLIGEVDEHGAIIEVKWDETLD